MLRHFTTGLLVAASLAAGGQARGGALYRVQASQVAEALAQSGMKVTARAVKMGADVMATTPAPILDVLGAESPQESGPHPVWIKLGCHASGECRPFFVEVRWSGSLPAVVKARQTEVSGHTYQPAVIRFGDRATLVAEGAGSRLEIAVIALQSGSAGQVIQLATPDHKLFYRGVVVSKSMLKGSF